MFDPDSFHHYLSEHYGSSQIIVAIMPHGKKTLESGWKQLNPFESQDRYHGHIFLHDQEPMLDIVWEGFKRDLLSYYSSIGLDVFTERPWLADLPSMEFFLSQLKSNLFISPIFCHSQGHSGITKSLETHDAIHAHYFYHAAVARSWYMPYKHWKRLQPRQVAHDQHRYLIHCRNRVGSASYREEFIKSVQEKLGHDWYDFDRSLEAGSNNSARLDVADADRSLHIVLETVFDQGFVHLTEKVFRPMAMSRPFVLLSAAGSLTYLKKYGFRTFDEIWDETYDTIQDHGSRMRAVIDLLSRFDSMPDQEFYNMIDQCQDIIAHNRDWFYGHDFEHIIISEISTSVDCAIKEQSQRFEQDALSPVIHQLQRFKSYGVPIAPVIDHFRVRMRDLQNHAPTIFQRSYQKNEHTLRSLGLA